jgi:3-keto-disaccharide hydrolase
MICIPMVRYRLAGFALLLVFASALAAQSETEPGFDSMFDGESLEGWSAMPPDSAKAWSVRDGIIVGRGPEERSYLVYDNREIADFELKLSYRFLGEGNSGVSIRARVDETGTRGFQSYHADFGHVGIGKQVLGAWDFHTPGRREHACFRGDRLVIDANDNPTVTKIDGALTSSGVRKGGWNDVHVIAKGNLFQLFINGKPASEFTEHLAENRRLHRGMIQLQLHDPEMEVHFRDLRIRILR